MFATLLIAASWGCSSSNKEPAPPAQSTNVVSVETVPVISRRLDTTVSLPAQLLPYESVDVYPRVTGFAQSIHVDVGSRVRKGEVLVELSAPRPSWWRSVHRQKPRCRQPFDGVVTARNLHPGALTGPASGSAGAVPILHIVDTGRLRLVVPIPEAQIGEMKEGRR